MPRLFPSIVNVSTMQLSDANRCQVSLGGVHSLVLHPASTVSAVQQAKDVTKAGVSPGMVRLSVGIEDVDDIVKDLQQVRRVCANFETHGITHMVDYSVL
jgi:O-acetylhomoserine/O-acetylserine sulfhydrylase-like pyridoxal-dependent enzyme